MTWNGRVNVHDDLSRLHSSLRAADTSREIGYSSVTQGEGSLDLLTEAGDVRASFGDQPDGRFGVSITHRGSLRFLPDLFTDLEDKDDAQDGRLDGHDTTLGQHGSRLDGHDSTLASHNTRIGNAQSRADSAWTRAGTALANAATAQSRADSAHDRIDGLNFASPGDITTLSNRIQALRSEVHAWIQEARASNPDLPPPIPN